MKRYSVESLASIVMETLKNGHVDQQIDNLLKRLEKLISIINKSGGSNGLVKSECSPKYNNLYNNLKFNLELITDNTAKAEQYIVFTAVDNNNDDIINLHVEKEDDELVEFKLVDY